MFLRNVDGGALPNHNADCEEHRSEHGQEHHQTMAYHCVRFLSDHGQHTEQGQHI